MGKGGLIPHKFKTGSIKYSFLISVIASIDCMHALCII